MINRLDLQGFDICGKKAAVIGCGGLGCHVATHLACAGIGTLLLCDGDTVTESNLNRQFLYTAADIGKHKVYLARERLQTLAPQTVIKAFCMRIVSPDDLAFTEGADILFAAVDNNAARAVAQAFCKAKGIPLVNGGVNGFFGSAYLFVPGKTPDLSAAGMLDAENPKTRSVTTTVGVIGALQAHLGIRYFTGDEQAAGALYIFDCGTVTRLPLRRSDDKYY